MSLRLKPGSLPLEQWLHATDKKVGHGTKNDKGSNNIQPVPLNKIANHSPIPPHLHNHTFGNISVKPSQEQKKWTFPGNRSQSFNMTSKRKERIYNFLKKKKNLELRIVIFISIFKIKIFNHRDWHNWKNPLPIQTNIGLLKWHASYHYAD